MSVFNVYLLNIFQVVKTLYKAKHNLTLEYLAIRLQKFIIDTEKGFLETISEQPKVFIKATSFAISSRESKIWSKYLHDLKSAFIVVFIS